MKCKNKNQCKHEDCNKPEESELLTLVGNLKKKIAIGIVTGAIIVTIDEQGELNFQVGGDMSDNQYLAIAAAHRLTTQLEKSIFGP